ncbi:hypothetical protein V8E55_009855 [Tylopilus felleus]
MTPPENLHHIHFVAVSYFSMLVTIVTFSTGRLITKFKTKYKIDLLSSLNATLRLAVGCDYLKKILLANSEACLSVKSINNDIALIESGVSIGQICAVELIGSTTRVPGNTLSTTLNQDEAVACGAIFACAFFSPTFQDIIKVSWEYSEKDPDDDTELVVFPRGNAIPSTKVLIFYRKGPFDIEASYAEPQGLPGHINPWVARFSAKSVPADPSGDLTCIKFKTGLNPHGKSAYVEEVEEKEDLAVTEVDGNVQHAKPPKKKWVIKKIEVPFTSFASSLPLRLLSPSVL